MKKATALLLSLSMIFALSACGSQNGANSAADTQPERESIEGKTLVVYFSATGNTEEAANYIAAANRGGCV